MTHELVPAIFKTIEDHRAKGTKFDACGDSFTLLQQFLNMYGYRLLITRQSVGDKTISVIKRLGET